MEKIKGKKDLVVYSKEIINKERLELFFEGAAGIEELIIFYTDFETWASRYDHHDDEKDPPYSLEKKEELSKKFDVLWDALIERMAIDDKVYETTIQLLDLVNEDDLEAQKGLKDKVINSLVLFLRKKVKELKRA